MIRRALIAIPFLAGLATLLAGETAAAQMPGPDSADAVPPWAWSLIVWGLLSIVAVLSSALIGLAARYTVAQLRRLDSLEASIREMSAEVKSLHRLSEGISELHRRIDAVDRLCQLKHYDGK